MLAHDWFESIRDTVIRADGMRRKLHEMRESVGPKAQQMGAIGHALGWKHDAMAHVDSLVDWESELYALESRMLVEIDRATDVLYGRSGRGGLAKELTSADADCICGYYLLGMSWRQVAREMVLLEDSADEAQWCRRRAQRALEYVDRVGADVLADS